MSIAQETSSEVTSILKGALAQPVSALSKFLFDIAKMRIEKSIRNSENKDVLSTVKYGQIQTKELEDLQRQGVKLAYTNFPSEHVSRLSELAPKYCAHFAVLKVKPGNIASVAFPEKDANAISAALKQIAAEQEERFAGSLKFKEGVISSDLTDTANTVLECHDIPTFMFTSSNNKTLAVVPQEFEQQFDSAVREAAILKDQVQAINVIKFEQTSKDLDNLDYTVEELSFTEANALNKTLQGMSNAPNVRFSKTEDDKVTIIYPATENNRIADIKNSYIADRANADKMIIDVIGNEISINKKSLVIKETAENYFTRVPNTNGEQYIYLNKNEFIENNGAISGQIDLAATYNIYNKDGKMTAEISGNQLAENYNGKSRYMNKDTVIAFSDTNELEHIELYNASDNKLIKLGIDNSENIKKALLAQGFNNRTSEIILKNISEKLNAEQKSIFDYKSEALSINYSDIPNIDELKSQYNVVQQIKSCGAINLSDNEQSIGSKIFVFDRTLNKYAVLTADSKSNLSNAVKEKFGFDYIKSELVANKAIDAIGLESKDDKNYVQGLNAERIDTNNILLHNVVYARDNDTMFVVADRGKGVDFISFDKSVPRTEIERIVTDKLNIKDSVAVAELMHNFDKMNVIPPCTRFAANDISVELTTSTQCFISNGDKSIIMPKDKIDSNKISDVFGVDAAKSEKICKSINNSISKISPKVGTGQHLNQVIKTASEKVKNQVIDKGNSAPVVDISKVR